MAACQACGIAASELQGKLLCCSRCKSAFYCSTKCQRSNWRTHKQTCGVAIKPADEESIANQRIVDHMALEAFVAPDELERGLVVDQPSWGGPLAEESSSQRLARVLQLGLEVGCYASRHAKAKELFRLGMQCFFEQAWIDCATGMVEGLLLDVASLPRGLAQAEASEGPESCPFGKMANTLAATASSKEAPSPLHLALLQVQWLDMQMVLTRDLCERDQNDVRVAEAHQQRWFELLLKMDDVARKAIEMNTHYAGKESGNHRLLSRLTLVQAQYGANPPLSRSPAQCAELAARAVSLWPEDIQARSWSARREDFEVLLGIGSQPGLLESDAPQHSTLRERAARLFPPG